MRWGGGGLARHEKENVVTPIDGEVLKPANGAPDENGSCGKQNHLTHGDQMNVAAADRCRRGRDYREGEMHPS